MAITKLRLQQIQDEVADFAKTAIPASHAADPETLHGMLQNLQKTIEMRFGADAIHADGIYKNADIGKVVEFGSGVTADATIKHLGTGKLVLSGAAEMELTADGSQKIAAASQDIDVVGGIVENAGSLTAEYGAASSISTSAGDLDLLAAGVMDVDGAGVEIDSSVAAHVKAAGGNLQLSSSAQASVEGATLLLDSEGAATFDIEGALTETAASKDADYVGAMSFTAGATSEFVATAGDVLVKSDAGDFIGNAGAKMMLNASNELSASAEGMELLANGGPFQASGAFMGLTSDSQMELTASADFSLDAGLIDIDTDGVAHILAGGIFDIAGSELELSASGTHIRFDDGYRADAGLVAYYNDGIKLADSDADWTSFQDAFGEKSILKAISEAAAGSATAVRAVFKLSANATLDPVTNDVKIFERYGSLATTYGPGSSWTSANEAYPVGTEYTADELDFAVEVYVNGQRLAQSEDFTIDLNSGDMDVSIKFALEQDDVVEVVIK